MGAKRSKVGENVLKRSDYLNLLAKSKNKKRRNALIDVADKAEILAISECIANALAGVLPLRATHINKMKKFKKKLRMISERKVPNGKKKVLIKQTGGILAGILPLALSAVGSLVSSFLRPK